MSAVTLPSRHDRVREAAAVASIWPYSEDVPASVSVAVHGDDGASPPPPANKQRAAGGGGSTLCEARTNPSMTCCRELREDKRTLVDPELVRNVILGLADGLTVPFGVTAGLAAIASSRIVVAGGVAEMVSGALSMGVGGYLSAKADRDHFRYLRDFTRKRIGQSCVGEVEREVTEVLEQVGLDASLCQSVARRLLNVEHEINSRAADELEQRRRQASVVDRFLRKIARCPRTSFRTTTASTDDGAEKGNRVAGLDKAKDEFGVTAFLLKFAEGQEDVPDIQLLTTAVTIGLAYAVGALVSLLPYFFVKDVIHALYISIGVTGGTLVLFGVVKAYFTGSEIGAWGYSKSAVETLFVGALAAGSAYGIGRAIEKSNI